MNCKLTESFTEEEVRRAFFQMHPNKAPIMDEFSALFNQRFWEVTKMNVCEEVLNFLNNGHLDRNLNITRIILLPNKVESMRVEDFRPITLSNVAMKIIMKVLTNRLEERLPVVI